MVDPESFRVARFLIEDLHCIYLTLRAVGASLFPFTRRARMACGPDLLSVPIPRISLLLDLITSTATDGRMTEARTKLAELRLL